MKLFVSVFFSLLCLCVTAEEVKEVSVSSQVNEVTVFIEGAQVTRIKTVDIPVGKSVLKFDSLSPFIDAKSVQAKVHGNVTVLSVNHQKNFVKKTAKSDSVKALQEELKTVEEKLELEYTYQSIIKEELAFLNVNRDLGGKNEQVSVLALQQASEYYGERLRELKLSSIEHNKTISTLERKQTALHNQVRTISSEKEFATGEVLVKVDSKIASKIKVEVSYLVSNAGWFPSYDVRVASIEEPIELIYKANVRQDTKEDWDNVQLSFSSSNPNVSGVAPELQTYFLNYYSTPPVYKAVQGNSVEGRVYDDAGLSMPGVAVMIEGSTIGTLTDIDGYFSITVPNQNSQLKFSFIGMETQTLRPSSSFMTVVLESNNVDLDEVVVVAYGMSNSFDMEVELEDLESGISTSKKVRGKSSLKMEIAKVENQTSVEFKLEKPYTVKSNNKSLAVDMVSYDLAAEYQYYCVPKVDKDAFLLAYINDWEHCDLLEGEANLFFENTYVGKTVLDVRYAQDTLELSLGRDKGVTVQRQKMTEYKSRRFVGNKREDIKAWDIMVKNNKSQPINMIVMDQVPVSTIDAIEIEILEKSGGKFDAKTGEVKWLFDLDASEKTEFELKYSVEYPKNKTLNID